jgi:hypothetical protein
LLLDVLSEHRGCDAAAGLVSCEPFEFGENLDVADARRSPSPDQVDDAHLYNLGWSLARVGERLGVDHTTVLAKLREHGIPDPRPHGQPRISSRSTTTR